MLDNMDPQCEENLYRKQYGNLKDCCLAGRGIMSVFQLSGTAFKFAKWEKIVEANANGILESEAWSKAQQGRISYLNKHLNLCKTNKMNICRACEMKYYQAAEHLNCGANDSGPHTPTYDFTLD